MCPVRRHFCAKEVQTVSKQYVPDCLDTQFDLVASSSSIPLIRLYVYKGLTITTNGSLWVTMLVQIENGELDDVHEHEKI